MTTRRSLPENVSVAEKRGDDRLYAPAAERNARAITDVLSSCAPRAGRALEIASGTGQHVAGFAAAMPQLLWQPTEIDAERRNSIDSWSRGAENILPAQHLDATRPGWSADHAGMTLIVVVNLLHLISSGQTRQLIAEATHALLSAGRLVIYGPFLRDGRATSEGDARFHASLRAADPEIGYKDVEQVRQWLADTGMRMVDTIDMPANNLTLISEKPQRP
ncbi:DUF938 domain-containing protein [Roseovarius sp. CAU 1744]|uniref:DUF938 domain-containing protein n=1 Tax=Roseovarius sp. CAU 1744 TaxID=3140368 RepID=UPI00325BAA54